MSDSLTAERTLNEIVGLMWDEMSSFSFGRLFPFVPPETHVADILSETDLGRDRFIADRIDFEGVAESTLDELIELASSMNRALDVIVYSLAQENAQSAIALHAVNHDSFEFYSHEVAYPDSEDSERRTPRNAFEIDAEIDENRLDGGLNPAFDIIEEFIYDFDDRDWRILEGRRLTKPPVALDALGAEFGLTRERIRQLEALINRSISDWFANEPTLQEHSRRIVTFVGRLTRLDDLLAKFPSLTEIVEGTAFPSWFVFDEFDDEFESDGAWVAAPTLASVRSHITNVFEENSHDPGYLTVPEFIELMSDDADEASRMLDYAQESGFRHVYGLVIAPYATALQNLAACVLDARGQAMGLDEIHAAIDTDRTIRSLGNALATDARFVRSGMNAWSLVSWGAKPYVSISDEIRKILDEHAEVSIDYVCDQLSTRFGVARASVIAYAGAHPFAIVNGVVKFAGTPEVGSVRPLHRVRRVYRLPDGGVAFRLTAHRDHLRGSGFVIPKHVAVLRGLKPGDRDIFVTDTGHHVRLGWSQPQPTMSTIRAVLQEIGVSVGDDFVIELRGNLALISRVPEISGHSSADIRARIGRTLESTLTLQDLSEAIDLELLSWSDARGAFENRREPDIALLIAELQRGGPTPEPTADDSSAELSRYEFSVQDPEPEALTFACVAQSLEEAKERARKAGFTELLLLEVRPLRDEERNAFARQEIIENPFLGPEWLPLVEALADSVSELHVGEFWTLNVLHPLFELDASKAPYIQAMQEADGSLNAELGSPQLLALLDVHSLAMLELMGWTPPTEADPVNYRRRFEPGWNIRHVAYIALQTLAVGFGIDTKALFIPAGAAADGFDKRGLLDRLSAEDGRMAAGEAYGLKDLHVLSGDSKGSTNG